jgi:hypothetical protein
LKLFHIQNELTKEHYLKATSHANSLQHMLPISSPSQHQTQQSIMSHHAQQQQQQQNKLNSTSNKSPNNNILSASQHFQNIFLMQQQQQQQQHQINKNSDLQSAAVAAFPQFFLNHYVPNLNHHRQQIQLQQPNITLNDPITSTPKKSNSFLNNNNNSSFSSPNSSSSSSSLSNSFNKSHLNASNSNNTLILNMATKCEPNHHSSTTV